MRGARAPVGAARRLPCVPPHRLARPIGECRPRRTTSTSPDVRKAPTATVCIDSLWSCLGTGQQLTGCSTSVRAEYPMVALLTTVTRRNHSRAHSSNVHPSDCRVMRSTSRTRPSRASISTRTWSPGSIPVTRSLYPGPSFGYTGNDPTLASPSAIQGMTRESFTMTRIAANSSRRNT